MMSADGTAPNEAGKILVCHWKSSGGWNQIEINYSALDGHDNHDLDIWAPVPGVTPGQNWPEGEEVYINGCALAEPTPTASPSPTLSISPPPETDTASPSVTATMSVIPPMTNTPSETMSVIPSITTTPAPTATVTVTPSPEPCETPITSGMGMNAAVMAVTLIGTAAWFRWRGRRVSPAQSEGSP